LTSGISTKATEYKDLAATGDRWESPVFSIGSAKESTGIPKAPAIRRKHQNRPISAGTGALNQGTGAGGLNQGTGAGTYGQGTGYGIQGGSTMGATNGTNGAQKAGDFMPVNATPGRTFDPTSVQ